MTTTFFYDLTGTVLIRSSSTDGSEYRYDYDLNNNLTKLYQGAAGGNWTTQYTYDADNRPVTTTAGGKTITDTYNATGTRANRTYGFTTPYTTLSYLPGANGSKTGMNCRHIRTTLKTRTPTNMTPTAILRLLRKAGRRRRIPTTT